MARPARLAATFSLLVLTILLMASGCSLDGPLDPNPAASAPAAFDQKASLAATSAPAAEGVFVETFANRRNVGGWSFQTDHRPIFEDAGGNPDGYLHDDNVASFAPHPGTELGKKSIFTGDYRTEKVTSLGIDLRSIDYDFDITNRYLTLILMNDNGTPFAVEDDWGAYVIGDVRLPSKYVAWKSATGELANAAGWVSYDFGIESQADEIPEGWAFISWSLEDGEMPGGSWTALMENVSYIQYYYGDPNLVYLLQSFDLGLDNARISFE